MKYKTPLMASRQKLLNHPTTTTQPQPNHATAIVRRSVKIQVTLMRTSARIIPFLLSMSLASCSFAVSAFAQQKSPKGGMVVEGERLNDGGPKSSDTRRIWLVSARDAGKKKLLFTHYRAADVVFSADEEWLVINDHLGSSEACALLFHKTGELDYNMSVDLSDGAWKFFCQQNGVPGGTGFDHSYVDCVQWLKGRPGALLLTLRGHADSRNYVDDWRCVYDTAKREFLVTRNLQKHNEGRTVLERP